MVKNMIAKLGKTLKSLHNDEQGAEMIEYVLVVAAIALPLVAVVIWYWKDLSKWVKSLWDEAKTGQGTDPDTL